MSQTDNTKLKEHIKNIGFTVLFIICLTLFCKALGYPLVIPLILFFIGFHLVVAGRGGFKAFLHLGLLLTILVSIIHATTYYANLSVFYVPVAAFAMLTMVLFNSLTLSFAMAFASSILAVLIVGGDLSMMVIFLLGSLAGVYCVDNARTRGQMMSAGIVVSIINVITLFLFHPYKNLFLLGDFATISLYPLLLNGIISVFFVVATLKIFELVFGVITNFSLLELSDFNQPLLKRMILEAPGTYHHSLVVSNLSEAAADSIGANSLLTRVGAYYHDIGKMAHPEYFTENQLMGGNKHDNIEPTMSRLVILNHVKEGIELAKKYKLNSSIVDFIPQHHGTGLIFYFYQKSIEGAEDGETVSEENFRYPGPKPQTRETAITLLADSVEGATRALDDPNPTTIEETVKKVINNKFIDGQLDECPLTLKEIDKISSTFTRILTAMYHGRVKYPEKKNGSSSKKSSEKNTSQPRPSQQDRQDNPSS